MLAIRSRLRVRFRHDSLRANELGRWSRWLGLGRSYSRRVGFRFRYSRLFVPAEAFVRFIIFIRFGEVEEAVAFILLPLTVFSIRDDVGVLDDFHAAVDKTLPLLISPIFILIFSSFPISEPVFDH